MFSRLELLALISDYHCCFGIKKETWGLFFTLYDAIIQQTFDIIIISVVNNFILFMVLSYYLPSFHLNTFLKC